MDWKLHQVTGGALKALLEAEYRLDCYFAFKTGVNLKTIPSVMKQREFPNSFTQVSQKPEDLNPNLKLMPPSRR